jgi:hypothetical protein
MAKLSLDDLITWALYLTQAKEWYRSAKSTPVGETTTVPEMVVTIGKQTWRIPQHTATRER